MALPDALYARDGAAHRWVSPREMNGTPRQHTHGRVHGQQFNQASHSAAEL